MEIKIQKVPTKKVSIDDVLAIFCYKYPQYTFKQAENMPFKRIMQMLKVAKRIEAERMIELVRIASAPHTKKGQGVKSAIEYYKGVIKDNE
ncbi:MAG: hypothetical protein LC096_05410 [Bacteroidia bacterium]|nr:hypothetical protein [Bacteroidia bacterium]